MTQPALSEREIYRRMYAAAQDSIFLLSADTHLILFANPKAAQDTGYEAGELEGMSFDQLFQALEDREAIQTLLKATLEWKRGTDPKRVFTRKSGKQIVIELHTVVVEFETKPAIYVSLRDITQRVKTEEKIVEYSRELEKVNSELEARVKERTRELDSAMHSLASRTGELDDVMNNIEQAIVTVGRDLKLNSEFSSYSKVLFGLNELSGLGLVEFFFPKRSEKNREAKQLREWLEFVFDEPEHWEVSANLGLKELEYPRKSLDGESFETASISLNWKPIFEKKNGVTKITKMIVVCNDITEQKRLARQINRQHRQHQEELELFGSLLTLSFDVFQKFLHHFADGISQAKVAFSSLEKGFDSNSPATLNTLRFLHTLKGNARQMRLKFVETQVHELEEYLIRAQKNESHIDPIVERDTILDSLGQLEESHARVRAICEKVANRFTGKRMDALQGSDESLVPIPLSRLEHLFERVFAGVGPYPASAIRRSLGWLIQIPLEDLFDRLNELMTALAKELYIEAVFEYSGGQVKVDPRMIEVMYEIFLHLIRNSLDHGREPVEERLKRGRARELRIRIDATEIGMDRIRIIYTDDGRGLDFEAIRKKVAGSPKFSAGFTMDQIQALSDEELIPWIFKPGFSTQEEATTLSGRGIGMDVVKERVSIDLGGKFGFASRRGEGVRAEVEIPSESFHLSTFRVNLNLKPETKSTWEHLLGSKIVANRTENGEEGAILVDVDRIPEIAVVHPKIIAVGSSTAGGVVNDVFNDDNVKKGLRYYVDSQNRGAAAFLRALAGRVDRFPERLGWGLEDFMWPSTRIRQFSIRDYAQKQKVIEAIDQDLGQQDLFSSYRRAVSTILDEMIMNAFFDAPRDKSGKPKYAHLPRDHTLVLEPGEDAIIQFGSDPSFIGISVKDPFGAINFDTLLTYLRKGYRKGDDQVRSDDEEGAGLGLFMIFDHAHYLVVSRQPGRATEMIALISQGRTTRELKEGGKSLAFFDIPPDA